MPQFVPEHDRLYIVDRKAWRAWLVKHHAIAREIWLIYYKKHTGQPTVPYDDAVEEALCFGWIDGKVQRLDDERYMQRYTPRRKNSIWSLLNRDRAERMMAEGRITEAGLAAVAAAQKSGAWEAAYSSRDPLGMPPELEAVLAADTQARAGFAALTPSDRLRYLYWITEAKRPETRQRRAKETARRLVAGSKPGT